MTDQDDLLTFFKALADQNRLRIVGLLAKKSYTVEEMAAELGLSASTISHHLSRLSEAGLVSATARSYYNDYHLNIPRLEEMAQRITSSANLLSEAGGEYKTGYDSKVVRGYLLPDGRLKDIPAQRKKLLAILRHVVKDFERGRNYSEGEVNAVLARYHHDTARLRRELVSAGLMAREKSGEAYWRGDLDPDSETIGE